MEYFFFWIVFGVIVALIARSKGRSGIGWFCYGLLIWPVALVHILIANPTAEGIEKKARAEGRKPCPFCAELIMVEAKVCPHCQRELTSREGG